MKMKLEIIMTRKISILILTTAIVLFTASSCKINKKDSNSGKILNKEYKEQIIKGREELRTFLFTSRVPGLSISVSIDNKIVWSEGIGHASKELNSPATRNTKFRIGNTSKMLTALTLAKLQEKGMVDLNKSYYEFIPEFPKKQFDFSPYLLGVNSAGFAPDSPDLVKNPNNFKSLKEYISFYENDTLVYEPNTYLLDSELSYALLGILAEDITETYYPKLLQETLLDTLKLSNTIIDDPYRIIDGRSECYYRDYIARLINAPKLDLRFLAPISGYLSTADDLNILSQTLLAPGFFSEESLDLFFTPNTLNDGKKTNRGFGWVIYEGPEGELAYVQLGSVIGGSSVIVIYPKEKLVLTACTNLDDNSGDFPSKALCNIFLERIRSEK